ncbi:MAG: acyl carrier protein [Pseudomonas sp.]|nr:acyl carrier protein [Pseudomonas sp.]
MEDSKFLEELQPIFREVFERDDLDLSMDLDATRVEEWDSLAHVTLVMRIEQFYGVQFALSELQDMKNVGDLVNLLKEKN